MSIRYFLTLDGLAGDSFDDEHVGWFEVSGFDIDLGNLGSVSTGSGSGTGKAVFSPLTLTLDNNTGLASFLALAATGKHLDGATLVGVTDGAKAQDKVYQLDLGDVLVTKVVEDEGPGLTLSLDYRKIELETFGQDNNGVFGPAGEFGYDLAASKDGVSVPSVVPSGSVAPSPQPTTYFMLIDGLDGGATDKSHEGWFEISGFDLDLANIGSTSTGSGAGPGKADFSPLNVVLPHEAGLAALMDFAATGEHVKGVRIEGIAAGAKSSTTVYDLTLANVLVTKVADAEGDGYSLSLDYSKIALVTQGIDNAGKISQNGAFGFDRTAGTTFDPLSLAPTDVTSGPLSINENSANGTLVGTLTGQDPDNQALAYTLTNNATGRFAIDNAGHVTVDNGVLLDFEQNASHTIGVRVTDSDGLVFDKSFVVTVNDLNPEVAIGDTGPNTIVGGSADDTVNGQGGDDVLLGGGGNDYITSGDGNDKAFGDAGNDTVIGANGDDYLNGGADADLLVGNDGADTLLGDTGNDYLDGGSGDDLVMGGAGDDTVLGADGTDYLQAGDGNDQVFGGDGADILLGDTGDDYLNGENGNDIVFGDGGNDTVIGGEGHDYLSGGVGNDVLVGGNGNDTLFAGSGSDYLEGDAGDDMFVFEGAFQNSIVVDFEIGSPAHHDVIQFSGGLFSDFADLMSHAVQSATSTIITDPAGHTLTLANVVNANLASDNFVFV